MAWTRPQVALLFMGGTTLGGSAALTHGVRRAADIRPWLQSLGELEMMAEVSGQCVVPEGQVVTPTTWMTVAKQLGGTLAAVDGVVILHEPTQAPLTALALGLMIQHPNKPIVITPGRAPGSPGGRSALINALQTATMNVPRVMYLAGNQIFDAVTLRLASETGQVGGETVGKVDFGIRIFSGAKRSTTRMRIQTTLGLPVDVRTLRMGDRVSDLRLSPDGQGLVLQVDSFAPVTDDYLRTVASALPSDRPVVCVGAGTNVPARWVAVDGGAALPAMVRLMVGLGRRAGQWRAVFTQHVPRP